MKQKRKPVILIVAGGASLVGADGLIVDPRSASDLRLWLKNIPELQLIAPIEPIFLFSERQEDAQVQSWQEIAETIVRRYDSAAGFVVTQAVDAIPYTAAAISLMLGKIGKPVIITGSPMNKTTRPRKKKQRLLGKGEEMDIRANIINAVQVATLDMGEVAVLFGNKLLRAGMVERSSEASRNIFESRGVVPLGRVDFGLKLGQHRNRRSSQKPTLRLGLKSRIMQLALVPSFTTYPNLRLEKKSLDGILITGQSLLGPNKRLQSFLVEAQKASIPVATYSLWQPIQTKDAFAITNVSPVMAVVKFMWALGQSTEKRKIQQLLSSNIAGEIITHSQGML